MNYIKHLTGFFETVSKDLRLNPTHISLYMGLFQYWNMNRFANPISISREEVMKISKISAKATYHKCIKELHGFGYIKYEPSYNPFRGSFVYLFEFKTSSERPLYRKNIKFKTGSEQALVPSINNTNILNQNFENEALINSQSEFETKSSAGQSRLGTPNLPSVFEYFDEKTWPASEAEKFYNYYQSNGWLIGGKTPMKDWKAAARNWILNSKNFKNDTLKITHRPGKLATSTAKNYAEPL